MKPFLFKAKSQGFWRIVARDPQGNIVAESEWENIVVNDGLDYLLEVGLCGHTQIFPWYIGLTDGTPTVNAADTPASHAGWTEVTGYDEATRQEWIPDSSDVSDQSVDNASNPATFTITNNGTTIGGAGLFSNNTKGGSTGRLYAAGAFTGGDVTLSAGSTLEVQATFTEAAA